MLPDDLFYYRAALQWELHLTIEAARAGCDVQDWRAAIARKFREAPHGE